jgi:hypothetical protein
MEVLRHPADAAQSLEGGKNLKKTLLLHSPPEEEVDSRDG